MTAIWAPSGAWRSAPKIASSSDNPADVISRKNFSTSRARSNGSAMSPLVTVPNGCKRYSNHDTAPKLPPPPCSPQKRSSFSSLLARTMSPAAVTTSAESRLSIARPCLAMSHPSPPPRVKPAMPVVDPASRRQPICLRLTVEFAPRDSTLSARCAAYRIDVNALHERQIKHQSALANSPAGNIMTAATHRQFEPMSAREVYRVNNVGVAHAAGNQRGPTIDQTFGYPPYLIVPGVIGTQEHAREAHG